MRIPNFKNKSDGTGFHYGQLESGSHHLLSEEPKNLRDGSKFESPIVDSLFSPSSFNGAYEEIAKLDPPPYRCQKSRIYTSWLCSSGPLTVSAGIPRTYFFDTEDIPITIEVLNESNIGVKYIKIELKQKIKWKVGDRRTEYETIVMKRCFLGGVGKNTSMTRIKKIQLTQSEYPTLYSNRENCKIVEKTYELKMEVHLKGPHVDLKFKMPLYITATPPYEFRSNVIGSTYPPNNEILVGKDIRPIFVLSYPRNPENRAKNIRGPKSAIPGNI